MVLVLKRQKRKFMPVARQLIMAFRLRCPRKCQRSLMVSVYSVNFLRKGYIDHRRLFSNFAIISGLPGVVFVLPDSYIDPVNKEYGGMIIFTTLAWLIPLILEPFPFLSLFLFFNFRNKTFRHLALSYIVIHFGLSLFYWKYQGISI